MPTDWGTSGRATAKGASVWAKTAIHILKQLVGLRLGDGAIGHSLIDCALVSGLHRFLEVGFNGFAGIHHVYLLLRDAAVGQRLFEQRGVGLFLGRLEVFHADSQRIGQELITLWAEAKPAIPAKMSILLGF